MVMFGHKENWPVSAPKNRFYLGSTDDDVDVKFVDEATVELPNYFVPTTWKSFQPQSEHQIFYSQLEVGQVADDIKQHQTYTMHNIQVNQASI